MNRAKPQHAPMNQFPIVDNELHIGGYPVSQLALIAGQTPFYVYDRQVMSAQVAHLRQCLPKTLQLHYAIKANPMPAVVQHMAGLTDGLDVASLQELQVALATGVKPEHISFAGPGKTDRELAGAIAAGVVINVESVGELQRIARLGASSPRVPDIAFRVNPDFELKASGMKMGGGPKAFGIDAEQLPALLEEIPTLSVNLVGLHIFSGSQNLRPEAIIEAHDNTFALAYRLLDLGQIKLKWLNIGGGLGIPYFPGEQPLPLDDIAANLQLRMQEATERLPDTQIVMELGRYFVGAAGAYICQVVDCKYSRDTLFAVTDGGLHHHLAASGNFGQVIRKNYPVVVANKAGQPATQQGHIVGPLCTPLDIIADNIPLPDLAVGDLIAVYQSGAYGFSASPRDFLSHPAPVQLLV